MLYNTYTTRIQHEHICTTGQYNTQITSQNGLRVWPDISVSIYVQVIGSNLHFLKPEKIFEGNEVRVMPTRSSWFSCYQVMFNSSGVFLLANTTLVLATEASNSWLMRINYPNIPICTCMLY